MQQMLPIKVGSYRVFNQVRESLSMEIHFHCYLVVDAPTHLSIHIRKTDSVCFFIVSEFAMFEGQGGHSCSFGILVVFAAFNVCHIQAAISVYFSFFCNNLLACSIASRRTNTNKIKPPISYTKACLSLVPGLAALHPIGMQCSITKICPTYDYQHHHQHHHRIAPLCIVSSLKQHCITFLPPRLCRKAPQSRQPQHSHCSDARWKSSKISLIQK